MGKASRREARERLKQERLKQQQRAKRNRLLAIIGAAVAVVALVVGGGYLYMSSQGRSADEWNGALAPQVLQDDGSVVMAEEGASAPVVEVYADFQCPACRQFETVNADTLKQLAAEGQAIVHYRPVSIFAQQSDPISTNSLRGGAAARAAADYGRFVQYNDVLFENQPREGQQGFSVEDLKSWGEEVGITDPGFAERVDAENRVVERFVSDYYPELSQKGQAEIPQDELATMTLPDLMAWGDEHGVDSSFLDGTYVGELLDATAAVNARYPSGDNRFSGTPSIYIDGTLQGNDVYRVNGLTRAVEEAAPGEVDTRPLSADDSATPSPSAAETSSGKE
ncbi:DsbA family protein [Marinitenerispora sediminis]|uniref:Thioredoxin n=1 Tax=Marinitenerispora sediminis TaxID=1931232 RepID=A0A368SYN0_9ACTN|nr:DsbA family protein [Marinitenerispora sediminis]RCV49330.1 thioredoxin [Marinitenerispora sediminis]RCV50735.1 thioredoxin [Marinitenerispora sediminis]RCV56333.1 thioredoxin [Marinitenerispora sediminis]